MLLMKMVAGVVVPPTEKVNQSAVPTLLAVKGMLPPLPTFFSSTAMVLGKAVPAFSSKSMGLGSAWKRGPAEKPSPSRLATRRLLLLVLRLA